MRIFSRGLFLSVALMLQPVISDARHQKPVAVVLDKPQAEIKIFDAQHPLDPSVHIPAGLRAATPYRFECQSESWLDDTSQYTDAGGSFHLVEKPRRFLIHLAESSVTWLPDDASDKLKEHEAGHAQIYQAIFRTQAEKVAEEAAEPLIDQDFEGSGPDLDAARAEINHKVTEAVSSYYQRTIKDLASKADQKYDALTDHGRNSIPTEQAVKQVLNDIL